MAECPLIAHDDLDQCECLSAQLEFELDAVLARMRAAFADVPEEQLMQDVTVVLWR